MSKHGSLCPGEIDTQTQRRSAADCTIQVLDQGVCRMPRRRPPCVGHKKVPDTGLNMRQGRRVGDSTYRLQIRGSMGIKIFQKNKSAEVIADLAKAYEGVNREMLVEQAIKHGYPLAVHGDPR
jgi:hypothetical protein